MTPDPVCCAPSDTVDVAARLMAAEDVGLIPVVECLNRRRLVFGITDRDLALRIVAEGRQPSSTQVHEVMTRGILTCKAGDDLRQALDTMTEHQVRRLPVIDDDQEIIGIITQADVATRLAEPEATAELVREISQPAGRSAAEHED
jgi:CBS domain-containing protein